MEFRGGGGLQAAEKRKCSPTRIDPKNKRLSISIIPGYTQYTTPPSKANHPMPIHSELDLRHWCKKNHHSPKMIRWTEPAINSTFGLPDLWVPHNHHPSVQVELKIAKNHPTPNQPSKSRITIRPNQRKQLLLIHRTPAPVGIIVAIQDTDIIYALRIRPLIMSSPLFWGHLVSQSIAIPINNLPEALDFFCNDLPPQP